MSSVTRSWALVRFALVVGLVLPLAGRSPASAEGSALPAPNVYRGADIAPQRAPALDPLPHPSGRTIYLKSGHFMPGTSERLALPRAVPSAQGRVHVLVQFDFIPRQAAKAAFEEMGVRLLDYVPDYAWIASVPAAYPAAALDLPGAVWAGGLAVDDKLDPAIVAEQWGSYNLAPDGTAAVYVVMHKDESLDTGRGLVEAHGGLVAGEVIGINMLIAELPRDNIRALATEDGVQWIEQAAPPLGPTNDGIRAQIGVDILQDAPYSLTGEWVDILIYDQGHVDPTHPDFGGRVTIGTGDSYFAMDHGTHVAGTAAGSGSISPTAQYRGMAPGADVISHRYLPNFTGVMFYDDPGDIEADWAEAQNSHGADIGNASLGSNLYLNYPMSCTLMGNYGATSVLMDQIVRGGNSVVGLGDRYIATWAAGNERGGACGLASWASTAPPANAKNPIHVGASRTDVDLLLTPYTSWGPTDDGRIKPTIVAGGDDFADDRIMSTIPDLYQDISGRDCDDAGDDYCYPYDSMGGTSMAAPAVAGGIALMLEHYRDLNYTSDNFWPSTAKAILIHTARDAGHTGPDYRWGYGQVDIHAAVDLISRKAFREVSIADDDIDVYYLIVPNDENDVIVSLAWDDYEATFNADPTLINDLDLELVAPSGSTWLPWILDPDNPDYYATRGVDSINNQEQVLVPAASVEIGTWLVRVRGTTVPQGPQSYSLVCEGCTPLNLGVCQDEVDGSLRVASRGLPSLEFGPAIPHVAQGQEASQPDPPLSEGELWQRSLEGSLSRPIDSQAEEFAVLEAQTLDDTTEGRGLAELPSSPDRLARPAADDLTVGNGCTYSTIAAAISAAGYNDRLLLEGGRTFNESLTIDERLTLQGGYSGCASGSSTRTTIDGGGSGTVLIIHGGNIVTLENLGITNGSAITSGGGIRFESIGILNMTDVDVYSNTAALVGGGLYVDGITVNLNEVTMEGNVANSGGGIYAMNSSSLDIRNSLFARNHAYTNNGGAVRLQNGATMDATGSTFAYNAGGGAGTGSGIYLDVASDLELSCSIVWGHAQSINRAGENVYYSDIQGGYVGRGNIEADPLFVNPGSSDYHLQSSSPAIDRCLGGPTDDLDGEHRPIVRVTAASPYDMGADEASGPARVGVNGACSYSTLRQAVDSASDGDTVRLAAGVFFENLDLAGKEITIQGGYNSGCTVAGSGTTRIEGSMDSDTVIYVSGSAPVTLRDLTIAWGVDTSGGGILTGSGTRVTLNNVEVFDNHASYGGGVYVSSGSVVTMTEGTTLQGNTATTSGGGARTWGRLVGEYSEWGWGVYDNCAAKGGGITVRGEGELDLYSFPVSGNRAMGTGGSGDGGGIFANGGTVDLLGTIDLLGRPTLVGLNTANDCGGGVYLEGDSLLRAEDITIGANCGFDSCGNIANRGGGLCVNGSRVEFSGDIEDNESYSNGGGIYSTGGSDIDLEGSQLRFNDAVSYGGGIYLDSGTLDIVQTQIHRNVAEDGGGIYQEGTGTSQISNTLVNNNFITSITPLGAGIRAKQGDISLMHVTLALNIDGFGFHASNQATGDSVSVYNSIISGNSYGFSAWAPYCTFNCNIDQSTIAGIYVDPQFVNPGMMSTDYHLMASSPAIDACVSGLPIDLEGVSRPLFGGYDMGAYEFRFIALLPLVLRGY